MSYFVREDSLNRNQSYKLKEIPNLNSPQKISQLNFSHNDIRHIPIHVTQASHLQLLDLSHNKISKIEHICQVSSLKFLNLSHNLITQIPDEMLQLVQMQNLDLGFNKITIMANIKILKGLVEMRTFKYQGFIEINLQGNEVLKKKGCRDIYHKWMNPNFEEYTKMVKRPYYETAISRTHRRIAKSLDPEGRNKENTMDQTHKTLPFTQQSKELHPFKQQKAPQLNTSKEFVNSSHLNDHLKMSPQFVNSEQLRSEPSLSNDLNAISKQLKSEMFKSGCNFKDGTQEVNETSGGSSQWIQACTEKLKQMANVFTLIITNDDVKGLSPQVRQKVVDQSLYAKEIINVTQEAISKTVANNFSKVDQQRYMQQIELMCNKVKQIHQQTIKIFNERDDLPLKFYKPWVLYFRQLKHLVLLVPQKIRMFQSKYLRKQQIQDLVNISPEKSEKVIGGSPIPLSTKKQSQNKIDQLLFSKDKQDFMLLSECKRSSSEKQLGSKQCEGQCENCLMMKWENARSKQQLSITLQRIQKMERQRQEYLAKIKALEEFKEKYNVLAKKQGLIVDELEAIEPSTYQNILLEQAKTIEYMIKLEPTTFPSFNSRELKSDQRALKNSVSTALEKDHLNTHLGSSNNRKNSAGRNGKKVSEFTVGGTEGVENANRGSSYFKNKNVTTINRSGEEPKTIISKQDMTTSQNKMIYQAERRGSNEIFVSQFNSEANSFTNSSNKNRHNVSIKLNEGRDQALKQRQSSIGSNKSKSNVKSHSRVKSIAQSKVYPTQEDLIMISEQSAAKASSQFKSAFQAQPLNLPARNAMEAYINSDQFKQIIDQKLASGKQPLVSEFTSGKFGGKIELKHGKSQKKRSVGHKFDSSVDQNKENLATQRVKHSKTAEFLDKFYSHSYKGHGYVPMKSHEAESYKRYMQYHLRNNIIDILSKKNGNSASELSRVEKKYTQLNKSQRLIQKKQEIKLHQNETDRSVSRGNNKTFR